MNLKEGDVYTVLLQNHLKKAQQGFKYFRIKYWDGRDWIVRFIRPGDTDWIALDESQIFSMIDRKVIREATPHERLDAIIMELKSMEVCSENP